MRPVYQQEHPRPHLQWLQLLSIGLFLCTLLLSPWHPTWAQDDTRSTLQQLSQGFTEVAERASPAVVFIEVARTMEAHHEPFNNPYEFFGEEFLERFFRQRRPERPRESQPRGQGSGFLISPEDRKSVV